MSGSLEQAVVLQGSKGFRQRLALSCISGKPVRIEGIRIDEPTPETRGLAGYEACILRLLNEVSDGVNIQINSDQTSLTFEPGLLRGGGSPGGGSIVFKTNLQRGLTYYLEFLLMIAPFMKFPLDIALLGVTDHPDDPAIDEFRAVVAKLAEKAKILPDLLLKLESRGLLPDGGGRVKLTCGIFKGSFSPFKLLYAGRVTRIRGTAFTCHLSKAFGSACYSTAREIFSHLLPDVHIYVDHPKGSQAGNSPGMGITCIAETMKGYHYAVSCVMDKSSHPANARYREQIAKLPTDKFFLANRDVEQVLQASGKKGSKKERATASPSTPAEILGERAACLLLSHIFEGSVVDSTYQWLPLYYMALADNTGPSRIAVGTLTPHSIELLRNVKAFLNLRFRIQSYEEAVSQARLARQAAEKESKIDPEGDNAEETTDEGSEDDESSSDKLSKARLRNQYIVTCVGCGVLNLARETF